MPPVAHLNISTAHCLAYHMLRPWRDCASLPSIIFLGGFKSDMTGTKAIWLEDWAGARGRGFLRFDYRGHGRSSGAFEDGCIGDWAEDASIVLQRLTDGPQILVGSSMGGWIALILARRFPERIAGLVGIAAAPDFTVDGIEAGMSGDESSELARSGRIARPSEYSDEPYVITRRLIEDGRRQLVLRAPLRLDMPVRLLHGTDDADVPPAVALRLLEHIDCRDARLTLVKGAKHRLSEPDELDLIGAALDEITVATQRRR